MEDNVKNIVNKIVRKELTHKEAESELLLLYSGSKRFAYLIAKEWGYSCYIQNACGIEDYALPNFIKEFELWYEDRKLKFDTLCPM